MIVRAGRLYIVLIAVILGGAAALRAADPFFLQALRLIAFDSYQRLAPQTYDPNLPIRIVDIDETSLEKVGQWPWPRTVMAELLDKLTEGGAASVAFDILFSEPDQTSPEEAIKRLTKEEAAVMAPLIAGRDTHDQTFARSLVQSPAVLAIALSSREGSSQGFTPKAGFSVAGDNPSPFIASFSGATRNLPILDDATSGIGAINWIPDRDQVIRRVPLVYRLGNQYVPALFVEALRVAQNAGSYILKASNASGETAFGEQTGLNHIKVGDVEIPTDADGGIWLQFRPTNPDIYVPAWKVLDGSAPTDDIAGRIILVGTSAPGLIDLRATPLDAAIPGVEIHAQALEHILSGRSLTRPDYAQALEIALMLVVGVLASAVLPRIAARTSALLGLSAIVFFVGGGWLAYRYLGLLLDPSYPAVAVSVLIASATLYVYRRVELQRGEVRRAFSHYVAPTVVDEIIAHPDRLELGGEVRELTLMFCDVRNFTSISETMTAHELTAFINSLLTPLSEIILERRGTIDKYMGDAIMAFWNAPVDDADHAGHACRSGLDMIARMSSLNAEWRHQAEVAGRPFKEVRIGIGVNSGMCCVGNLGSAQRFDYSAIGDDVNVASRYEGMSKLYAVPIVVGEPTIAKIGEVPVLELDVMRVKGRSQPTRIFTLLEAFQGGVANAAAITERHQKMLSAYRSAAWDAAEAAIAECRATGVPGLDDFYAVYEKRIAAYRVDPPPPDWDGTYSATTK